MGTGPDKINGIPLVMMVEVFKTNIHNDVIAGHILAELNMLFPAYKINFDLDDCDKILRVEGDAIYAPKISHVLKGKGFECDVLD